MAPRRALLVLIAAVVTSALLVAGGTPAGAAERRGPDFGALHLEVRAADVRVAPGGRTVLTASLVRGGRPLAGRSVVLQQRTSGTKRWHTVHGLRTDEHGSATSRSALLRRSEQFRVRYRAAERTVASNVVSVVVPTWITAASETPLTLTAGAPVVLSGSTSSQLAGARVFLQTRIGDVWKTISSAVVAPGATYSVRGKATRGGDQSFRTLVKAAAGCPETASEPVDVTAYAWYRLAELPRATSTGTTYATGRAAFAGEVDEQSLTADLAEGASARAVFPLDERCTTFRGRLAATSSGAFAARWRLFADDDVPVDQVLAQGAATDAAVDITGAAFLALVTFGREGAGSAVWGNPEVLCAGRP